MTDNGEPVPASSRAGTWDGSERRRSTARLFDVRRIIGGLFVVYGVLVGTMGILDSPAQLDKAQGVNINLWAGLGMFVLGALFLIWQWVRPAAVPSGGEEATTEPDDR